MLSDGRNGNKVISNSSLNGKKNERNLLQSEFHVLKGNLSDQTRRSRRERFLRKLHEDFVLLPADEAANNTISHRQDILHLDFN